MEGSWYRNTLSFPSSTFSCRPVFLHLYEQEPTCLFFVLLYRSLRLLASDTGSCHSCRCYLDMSNFNVISRLQYEYSSNSTRITLTTFLSCNMLLTVQTLVVFVFLSYVMCYYKKIIIESDAHMHMLKHLYLVGMECCSNRAYVCIYVCKCGSVGLSGACLK